ncbi:hypothetical protein J2128_001763 [Methanomicrobium sp. W14]|uniref:hypothetical protein n=1 Tax=Methanomicrobium sp. W14 TaxID=2817839 RepID=UPI001AE87720|nr:hypothetical protein [Methanomicrobium sp. W14]MBP2133809.1 hypothetical protein [Methanomicrobium sp. W14]
MTAEDIKKAKDKKGPCTGEHCTIEMCRHCHTETKCPASKAGHENVKENKNN